MLASRSSRTSALGALRLAVGVGLLVAPRRLTGLQDPSAVLLIRTIGVRDLVLGAGVVTASGAAADRWNLATVASDSLDVLVGSLSLRSVGVRGGLAAALIPVPFAAAGVWARRGAARP